MEKIKEELSVELYNMYGIAEWPQKYALMTISDRVSALNYFKGNGEVIPETSELIEQLKLPFPKFVVAYLSSSKRFRADLEQDPQLPYKVFYFTDSLLEFYGSSMKGQLKPMSTSKQWDYKEKIEQILWDRIDDLSSRSVSQMSKKKQLKFTYLTQYIGLEEAKRLGLTQVDFFTQCGVDGYEFDKKMELLNPCARQIMILFLGLYGHRHHGCDEIAKIVGCPYEQTLKIVNILFPLFVKSTGMFENAIGYNEEKQIPGNMHEYSNKLFREADILLETARLFKNLDETSKSVLLMYPFNKRKIYLATKYMFKDASSLARNLCLSSADASSFVEQAKNL